MGTCEPTRGERSCISAHDAADFLRSVEKPNESRKGSRSPSHSSALHTNQIARQCLLLPLARQRVYNSLPAGGDASVNLLPRRPGVWISLARFEPFINEPLVLAGQFQCFGRVGD